MSRRALAALFGLACLAAAPAAPSDNEKAACLSSYERGQRLRQAGELRAAREEFLVCARDRCPAALRPDCAEWLAQTDRAVPSILVVAHGPDGAELLDVRVAVDGVVLAEHLDGRALPADPGEHTFRFEHAGAPAVEQRLVLHEGEKAREIAVTFVASSSPARSEQVESPMAAPSATAAVRDVSLPAYVIGGVGIAALASFALFGILGRTQQVHVLDHCAPSCPSDEVSSVRAKYLVADVSLGVSILALGAAAVLLLTKPGSAR